MPEVARCNTIEVGEPVVRAGSKIEACDQVEQALIGAIRDSDGQRFLVKSFDIAADEVSQQRHKARCSGSSPLNVSSFCWKILKVRKPSCCCESHACKSFMSASSNDGRSYGLIQDASNR
jgi:hypothetical protein